jgi:hypothetical protein
MMDIYKRVNDELHDDSYMSKGVENDPLATYQKG